MEANISETSRVPPQQIGGSSISSKELIKCYVICWQFEHIVARLDPVTSTHPLIESRSHQFATRITSLAYKCFSGGPAALVPFGWLFGGVPVFGAACGCDEFGLSLSGGLSVGLSGKI